MGSQVIPRTLSYHDPIHARKELHKTTAGLREQFRRQMERSWESEGDPSSSDATTLKEIQGCLEASWP